MDVFDEESTVPFLHQKCQDLLPRPGAFLRPAQLGLGRVSRIERGGTAYHD